MSNNNKKKKDKKRASSSSSRGRNATSTEEFFATSMMDTNPPTIETQARGMEELMKNMFSAFQNDDLASLFGPPEITPRVKEQVRWLPHSPGQIWFADCQSDHTDEGISYMATVFLVDKEHGSNGKPLPDSNGLGLSLASVASVEPLSSNSRLDQFPYVLGAIVKACLEPLASQQSMFPPKGTMKKSFRSQRPGKLLLSSSGAIQQLESELRDMGISNLAVADSALLQSAATTWDRTGQTSSNAFGLFHASDPHNNPNEFRQAAASMIMSNGLNDENLYVSEERRPLKGWKPPEENGQVPLKWYARPPPSGINPYRLTELWGWRTNLERATLSADTEKVKEIANRNDSEQVREFCECRILLTKVAEKGMVDACRALLDECGVSIEGVQAPDAPRYWRPMQRSAGDATATTPLHRAAFEGRLAVVQFLLERGASVTAIDEQVHGTALHHAVSQGHVDCVQVLCEYGSNHSYCSPAGGDALDISYMMEMQGGPHVRAQRNVRETLRQYDPRCSHCRADNPANRCPCHMERYCNRDCQRARWKEHKKLHRAKINQQS